MNGSYREREAALERQGMGYERGDKGRGLGQICGNFSELCRLQAMHIDVVVRIIRKRCGGEDNQIEM